MSWRPKQRMIPAKCPGLRIRRLQLIHWLVHQQHVMSCTTSDRHGPRPGGRGTSPRLRFNQGTGMGPSSRTAWLKTTVLGLPWQALGRGKSEVDMSSAWKSLITEVHKYDVPPQPIEIAIKLVLHIVMWWKPRESAATERHEDVGAWWPRLRGHRNEAVSYLMRALPAWCLTLPSGHMT